MTREQQREIKEAKKQAKIALRIEAKQDRHELKNWNKSVEKWKAKGGWIEETVPA